MRKGGEAPRSALIKRTPLLPVARETAVEAQTQRLRRLRTRTDSGELAGVLIATLRVRIPRTTWTGPFSLSHPEVRMEVLNRSDVTPDVSVSDYWIDGATPGGWAREILSYDEVLKVDSLAEVGGGCVYRITYQNPPVIYLYRRLGLPIQLPLRIQSGSLEWEVVARRSEFEEVMSYARGVDPDLAILSIRRRPLRSHLPMLTVSQQALLSQAMAAGYFAVPRGITLTALARRLHRSKSAVSERIALVEKKLLESAIRTGIMTAGAEAPAASES
jgi:hypothetical protein